MKRPLRLVAFQHQRQFPTSFTLRFHGFSSFSSFSSFSGFSNSRMQFTPLLFGFPSFPSFPSFPIFKSDLLALHAASHFDQRRGLQLSPAPLASPTASYPPAASKWVSPGTAPWTAAMSSSGPGLGKLAMGSSAFCVMRSRDEGPA